MSASEVDNFGRTIEKRQRDDEQSQTGPSQVNEDESPSGWGFKGHSPPKRSSTDSYSRPRDSRNFREQGNTRSRSPPSFPRNSPPRGPRSRLPPMKSYKNFLITQSDDTTPETFQKRYDEYQIQYCKDTSDYFFEKNKCEEWFRERYDPLLQQALEKESKEWGVSESKRIFDLLTKEYNSDSIQFGLSLSQTTDKPEVHDSDSQSEKSSRGFLHHFDGHLERTIYIHGIPANCTKTILSQSIRAAFTTPNDGTGGNGNSAIAVDRIVISQPTWSTRAASISAFERVGWVIFSAESNIIAALKALRELKVAIPGPIDSATGESNSSISFRLQANLHSLKDLSYLPDVYSQPSRLQFDFDHAHELAVLYDEEKNIPSEHNLDTLLAQFPDLPLSQKLDLIILYLRRVHFFVYYVGKRFHDEAHLTAFSSSISFRRPAQPNEESSSEVVGVEKDAVSEKTTSEENPEKTKTDEEKAEMENSSEKLVIPLVNLDILYQGRTIPTSENLDIRIKEFILQARQRVAQLRKAQSLPPITLEDGTIGYPPRNSDEEDCQAIEKAQEKVMEQVATENCVIQADGKARCGLTWCNKLFKGKDFLSKHIRNKHLDLAFTRLIRVSEKYMYSRFIAEEITQRPLGPIEVEIGGGLEQKTVKEVYEAAMNRLNGGSNTINSFRYDRNSTRGGRAGGREFTPRRDDRGSNSGTNDRDYQYRDRNSRRFSDGERRHYDSWSNNNNNSSNNNSSTSTSTSSNNHDDDTRYNHHNSNRRRDSAPSSSTSSNPPPSDQAPPRSEDFNPRKLNSYHDVDSPMDVAVNIDYGVALPAPKKRKLLTKTE